MKCKPRLLTLMTAVAAAAWLAPAAHAAIQFNYATDVASVTLAPGETRSVALYLVETVTGGTPSRLATEDGLSSASVHVAYVPSALADPSFIGSISANTTDFNDPVAPEEFVAGDSRSAHIREYLDISAPSGPMGTDSAGVRQVLLGTVTVVGGLSDGVTTFEVRDIPVTNDTVTVSGFAAPLDPDILSTSFSVTVVVPEPASVLTCATLTAGLLAARKRR